LVAAHVSCLPTRWRINISTSRSILRE
jgi:hypothetical protein